LSAKAISIVALGRKRVLRRHENGTVEAVKQWADVSRNKDVRIDPDHFIGASVEQSHDGLRLYVPTVVVLQAIRLEPNLRVRTKPATKVLIGNRIKKADRHTGRMKIQAC
jgi:hypothetical protein